MIIQLVSLGQNNISIQQCKPMQGWFNLSDDFHYDWIFPSFLLLFYEVVVSTAFIIDALLSRSLALDENIGISQNFLHFISPRLSCGFIALLNTGHLQDCYTASRSVVNASKKHALAGKKEDESKMKSKPLILDDESIYNHEGGTLTCSIENRLRNQKRVLHFYFTK